METNDLQKMFIAAVQQMANEGTEKKAGGTKTQATADVKIKHEGSSIVLPALPHPMDPGEAAQHLQRLAAFGEKVVSVNEIVKAYPFDGAVAFMKAMQLSFGWAHPEPTPGFFGDRPPATISVDIGVGKSITIFWGQFSLPGIDGKLGCGAMASDDGEHFFVITGQVKQKCLFLVQQMADLTRQIVQRESIYRGKALFVRTNDEGDMDPEKAPGFLNVSRLDPLILPDVVNTAVTANVFTPVEKTSLVRQAGIPLKRGIILAGPPGTGKTLTSQHLASKCEQNGWTFILVPNCQSLTGAIQFASRYSPAVIFAEDIDRATDGERDANLDALLNTVDGVGSKSQEVMVVFTTNKLGGIERTMVRPGRIDAIIEFPAPDHTTRERFLRHFACGMIPEGEDLMKSVEALEGAIPAIVREAVERSKLYALARGAEPGNMVLKDNDIFVAVETMKAHIDFFQSKRETVISPEEQIGLAFRKLLEGSSESALEEVNRKLKKIANTVGASV